MEGGKDLRVFLCTQINIPDIPDVCMWICVGTSVNVLSHKWDPLPLTTGVCYIGGPNTACCVEANYFTSSMKYLYLGLSFPGHLGWACNLFWPTECGQVKLCQLEAQALRNLGRFSFSFLGNSEQPCKKPKLPEQTRGEREPRLSSLPAAPSPRLPCPVCTTTSKTKGKTHRRSTPLSPAWIAESQGCYKLQWKTVITGSHDTWGGLSHTNK